MKVLYPKKLKRVSKDAEKIPKRSKQRMRKMIMKRYSKKKDFDVRDIVKDMEKIKRDKEEIKELIRRRTRRVK